MKSKSKYQIVSIGDCTIDAFIRLHEASVHCDIDKKNCQICLSFADKIPYDSLEVIPAVGNSSNVAVGAASSEYFRKTGFHTKADDLAENNITACRREKVAA